MIRICGLLVGLLVCSGCVKRHTEQAGLVLYSHPDVDSKSPCDSIGGYWFRSTSGDFLCDEPAADAGKACNDSHDCEGACVTSSTTPAASAAVGRCDKYHVLVGRCINEVRDGRASGVSCAR